MKKIYSMIIGLLLLFPFTVYGKEGISNYFIDLTVEENGDVHVKELFYLDGSFNGYERTIAYKNASLKPFTGDKSSFEGSDIYNGDSIELIRIQGMDKSTNPSMDDIHKEGEEFQSTSYASKGDYGVYTKDVGYGEETYTIYNPSFKQKGFYLEYRIKNMAVLHNDVAELGYNIFSNLQKEYIEHLEMNIHLPNNKTELRAWGHGPLWGETQNIGNDLIKLTISKLNAHIPVDIRVVFDREVISSSSKISNVDALNSILEIEKRKADYANSIREQARRQHQTRKNLTTIMTILYIIWLIGFVIYFIYIYIKYDKEYKSSFDNPYYRDFPSDDIPSTVGYLMNKKIGTNELSASILNLIYQKKIDFEPLDKKDYKLIKKNSNLSDLDQKLCKFLFGDEDIVTLSALKKTAKKQYSNFLEKYNSWINTAMREAKNKHYFEEKRGKYFGILYVILGWILLIISSMNYLEISGILSIIMIVSSCIFLIYIFSINKRTKEGNELYSKWKALKKFMLDFGNFEDKELPEVRLWEKYLVYAIVFGCASKLSKQMKIKIESMGNLYPTDMIHYHSFSDIVIFNHIVSSSVSSAISTATSARTAASSNSSSGGFGGGFSGGGGSFGGGGGGGRF